MSKLELAVLIDEAVEHALKTQKHLLDHKEAVSLMPIIRRLNGFAEELHKWRLGKFYLKDISERFIDEARQIEDEADQISENLWTYAPVPLLAICNAIRRVTRQAIEDKTFTKRLKDHHNNVRLRLLQQVAGARLLEHIADSGGEVERIFTQHLIRTLGSSVQVLRGGHIYDHKDNRSKHQLDIIITPHDALAYCPAETEEGKYNVMIDQVLTAISVKTTLNATELEECWDEIQGIPEYAGRTEAYPNLANEPWPLCFIVAAYTESLDKLEKKWDELRAKATRHVPQMVLVLDSGYMIPRDASWPYRVFNDSSADVRVVGGLAAGLGLAWLNAGIVARSALLNGRRPRWIWDLVLKLVQTEAGRGVPASYEPRFHHFGRGDLEIQGVLRWGGRSVPVHNRLQVWTIKVNGTEITDPNRPVKKTDMWQYAPYEYRLFRLDSVGLNGKFCALEEWIDSLDKEHHRKRIAVFDSMTGQEILDPRFELLHSVSEFTRVDVSGM